MSTMAEDLAVFDRVLAGEDSSDSALAAIVAAARDDRIEPSAEFRSALDARVAERFPRRRRRLQPSRRLVLGGASIALAAGIAGVIAIGAITGGPTPQGHVDALSAPPTATTAAAPSAVAGDAAAVPAAPPSAPATVGGTRRVQRDASLELATSPGRLERTASEITAAVDRAGGIVQRSNVTSGGGPASQANFELSIPTRNLETTLSAISALGHVRSRTQNTQDVTDQYNGLTGQLSEAYAERQGLLRQLASARTPNATASVKARLRLLAERISSLRSQTRSLAQSTDNTHVTVTLTADQAAAAAGPWTLRDAAGEALRVLVVCAGALLIGLAVLVPLCLLAGLVLLAQRRRREHALDA